MIITNDDADRCPFAAADPHLSPDRAPVVFENQDEQMKQQGLMAATTAQTALVILFGRG